MIMSQTTVKLDLRFKTATGKSRLLGIQNPKANLSAETVKSAMNEIVAQKMFENEDGQLYDQVKGARYVTRTVDEIFEVE